MEEFRFGDSTYDLLRKILQNQQDIGNIEIDTDAINLNTDDIETILTSIDSKIAADPSTHSAQVDGSQKTQIVDGGGDVASVDSGRILAQSVPDRPSQGSGRTYVTSNLAAQVASATAYTVTVGKTLYVTSIVFSAFNTSGAAGGNVNIADNLTVKIPISFSTAGLGALASSVPASAITPTFLEPIRFTTSFRVNIVAGTITYSVAFVGYEE